MSKAVQVYILKRVLFIFFLICVGVVYLSFVIAYNPTSSIHEVNKLLGVDLPPDASNINIQGTARSPQTLVSFDLPKAIASEFAGNFCEGVLHHAYDPFNSIEIAEPFTFAHRIAIRQYVNYSYSPEAPDTLWGNRCASVSTQATYLQITVDTSHPEIYHIRIGLFYFSPNSVQSTSLRAVRNLPIWFSGLENDLDLYSLTGEELCIGISPGTVGKSDEGLWKSHIPSEVKITVNEMLVASAELNAEQRLINRRNGAGNLLEIDQSGNEQYYCFNLKSLIPVGSHTLSIEFDRSGEAIAIYTWRLMISG